MRFLLEFPNLKSYEVDVLKNAESLISEVGFKFKKEYDEEIKVRRWIIDPDQKEQSIEVVVEAESEEEADDYEQFINEIHGIDLDDEEMLASFMKIILKILKYAEDVSDSITDEANKISRESYSYMYKGIQLYSILEKNKLEALKKLKNIKRVKDDKKKLLRIIEVLTDFLKDPEIKENINLIYNTIKE